MAGVVWIIISILGLVLIFLGAKTFFHMKKTSNSKYPEGYYLAIGVAIGTAMGIIFDILPIGVGAGIAIGAALEAQAKREGGLRPLTENEKRKQKLATVIGMGILIIAIIILILFR